MPLYEYKCKECGEISEILVGSVPSDAELKCESCNSSKVERILSVPASPVIKGSSPPAGRPSCGNETTCCGRPDPCAKPPCGN